jgi:predicted NAD-dependent protein-ADP-ribosyltransferase YbiA (DUF1768 family)
MTTQTRAAFTPATDGVDHVNVYSRGRTAAGRLLSNFAPTPFTLDGARFASVEGFYYSLHFDSDAERAALAALSGRQAKARGRKSRKRPGDLVRTWDGRLIPLGGEAFDEEICRAIRAKVGQNPAVQEALLGTGSLPLTHYYVMWGRVIAPRGDRGTLVACLTSLREQLGHRALSV